MLHTSGDAAGRSSRSAKILVELVLADRGWIVEKLAREIAGALPSERFAVRMLDEPSGLGDITYFIPYSAYRPVPGSITGAWFTHQEQIEPAKSRFVEIARAVDFCLTPADRYKALLRGEGVDEVSTILHGVDLDKFEPELRIGVVGRTYHTGRKGEALIASLLDLEGVKLSFTGEGWPLPNQNRTVEGLAEFYRGLDYLLIPSTIEGGPVPLFEALASGCPVIASDVGCVPDFPHIPFCKGDGDDLRRVVKELRDEKFSLRNSVADLTWMRFGKAHGEVFERMVQARGNGRDRARREDEPLLDSPFALVTHGSEDKNLGGPTTRIRNILSAAAQRGAVGGSYHGYTALRRSGRAVDPVHVFNSWPLKTAVETLSLVRRQGHATVFSPIALNLSTRPYFQDVLPKLLADASSAGDVEEAARSVRVLTNEWDPASGVAPVEGVEGHFSALRRAVGSSDATVFLSAYEQAFVESVGARPANSRIIRNGVDTAIMAAGERERFEQQFGVRDFILLVGRIESRKNQALLAFALRNFDLPVVCIGHIGDPAYYKSLRRWAGKSFVHIERIDDRALLAGAYKAARVLVLVSWSEGAPLAALEAAAAGTPLVLSTMSSEREYFGDLASYAHPADLDGIRDAVGGIIESPRDEAGRRHRSGWACENFDIARHAEETLSFYGDILAARGYERGAGASVHPALDVTHLAHRIANKRHLTGVTAVEQNLAKAMQAIEPGLAAYAWNSPQRTYCGLNLEAVLSAEDAETVKSTGELPGTSREYSLVTTGGANTAAAEGGAGASEPLNLRRAAYSAFKQSVNALPDPAHRAAVSAIRNIRPSFNPEVAPHHRVFGGQEKRNLLPDRRHRLTERVKVGEIDIVTRSRPVAPFDIAEDTLYLFGQPWISNDRQLEDLADFVVANRLKLRPLIHDILYVTDSSSFSEQTRQAYRRRLLRLLRFADRALVTSKTVERDLQKFLEMEALHVPVQRIKLGLPPGAITAVPLPPRISLPERYVLYVSSMNSRKLHDFLIDVWQSLAGEIGANARIPETGLVLVGEAQEGFEHFADAAFLKQLRERGIYVLQGIEDEQLAWLYANAAFTVFPSRSEGWGFPPLESLAFGKPCLASNTIPSVRETENGGLIKLPPGDFFAWRSALRSFLFSPAMVEAFAERAGEYVPQSWELAARELLG
ncbi:glycosyltransferase [Parvularcula oceani]|uniref:glycosyltransferase n=1 Tax=Parvularcula oceani TaxID=1247963 RepID=UPI00068A6A9E|nr:glycosyltransferase [Parvularcula oceani]